MSKSEGPFTINGKTYDNFADAQEALRRIWAEHKRELARKDEGLIDLADAASGEGEPDGE